MSEIQNIALDQSIARRKYSSLTQYDIKHNAASKKTEINRPEQNAPKKRYAPSPLELYEPGGDVRSEQPATLGINVDIII